MTGKKWLRAGGMVLLGCSLFLFTAFRLEDGPPSGEQTPLDNGTNIRNLIVIISDIHLGGDAGYQECNANRSALVNFLDQVRNSPNVKELVIAGDLFDEWFVPGNLDTYRGGDQQDFVKRIASTNQPVFDAFNSIIQDGKITVTYVPGNHDLTITDVNVSRVLPGIRQARDAGAQGLGSYSPAGLPEMVIEHGHRYNFFCAPDPISNQSVAPGTILPPGYFFTRIAAMHVVEHTQHNVDTLPPVTKNGSGEPGQVLLYNYWHIWSWAINFLPVNRRFDDKFIKTNVNGFTGNWCVKDLIPYQQTPGGPIQVNLFNGIQDTWESRCRLNHLNVPIPTDFAIKYANSANGTDTMAYWQYFNYAPSGKRIVVFGHTHEARIKEFTVSGNTCIYANSGTWIDHNPNLTTMNFVIIIPQSSEPSSRTFVRLYNFQKETMTLMDEKSVRL